MIDEDPISKVLYIDLSRKNSWIQEHYDLFERYIGGTGAAIHLLSGECPKGIEPLAPQNCIIFAVGQLNCLFPMASKTVAMFKSPLTGNLGESHAGGRSAEAIRMAGYGAIIIKGRSDTPIYLTIHGDKVRFQDASVLWGMSSSSTVGRIIREREPGAGIRTIIHIGRAGEQLVSYACVITETYRHFGRLGLGAVFGSKNLKALVISGRRSLKPKNKKLYRETYDDIFNTLTKSDLMKKYHELGTSMNVNAINEIRGFPTKNLTSAHFQSAEAISGETLSKNFLGRRIACAHCPVSCVHIAALREPYETKPFFYKTKMISYDYELIYALGSMLGIGSPSDLIRLIDEVEQQGLDAMSIGVVLAWATEMQKKNKISEKETSGLKLMWGDYRNYIKAIKMIIEQSTPFFNALSKGVEYAGSKYSGSEFALSFGGNEMPGYHTGPACHIGYLVGSRHSHLDGAGYGIDQKILKSGNQMGSEEMAEAILSEEKWRQIISSLVVCFFARNSYTPEVVSKSLLSVELDMNPDDLIKLGSEILKAKYRFKQREGFRMNKLRIPTRIYEIPTSLGKIDEDFISNTIYLVDKKLQNL